MTGAGVVLLTTFLASSVEAIEMVIIVLGVGAARGWRSTLVRASAVVIIGAIGFALKTPVTRIPRSLLQLIVGTLLTSFGTFWALEGLGVTWPQSDVDILALLVLYGLAAATFIGLERRAMHHPSAEAA